MHIEITINGIVTEIEDNLPGGFNEPKVDDDKSRRLK
jgi:hypothetical protein